MATLFRSDGTVQTIVPENKEQGFEETDIINLLGSPIQAIPLDKGRVLFIERDAYEQQKNNRATDLVRGALRTREAPARAIAIIHGNALVIRYEEMKMGQMILTLKAPMY